MNVTEFVDRLRARDVEVIVGRHLDPYATIRVGDVDEVTDDKHVYLNAGRDGIYVDRKGRVWILGAGTATVRVELPDAEATTTEAQDVAVGLLAGIDEPLVVTSDDPPPKAAPVKKAAAKKATAKR